MFDVALAVGLARSPESAGRAEAAARPARVCSWENASAGISSRTGATEFVASVKHEEGCQHN